MAKKEYCTAFPDNFLGYDLKDCCQKHDQDCGQAGSFDFIQHQKTFYNCLKQKGLGIGYRSIITFGGAFFCLLECPYLAYKKFSYRRNK